MDHIKKLVAEAEGTAERNVEKCDTKISKLDTQIEALQERKQKLVNAKRQMTIISKLSTTPEEWEKLSNKNKWEKNHVLAVFCCTAKTLPRPLQAANWEQQAPVALRNDRDVLIARASHPEFGNYYNRYDVDAVFRIPDGPLLADAQVVAAVAAAYPKVLVQDNLDSSLFDNEAVFEAFTTSERLDLFWHSSIFNTAFAKFSPRICSDAERILQAAKKGLNVFSSIAGELVNDRDFCIQLASTAKKVPAMALERFSDTFKADRQVVLAYIDKNGLCLKHAALTLRQDLEIVCAAADSEASSLQFCPEGWVKTKLGSGKVFMLDVMRRCATWQHTGHRAIYRMLSPALKLDLEMVVAARQGRCLDAADLPDVLSKDPVFWKTVLAECSTFWGDLPDDAFKSDIAFVRCIKGFNEGDYDLVREILSQFPTLADDNAFWSDSVLGTDSELYEEVLKDLIMDGAGSEVRQDRELMLRACARSSELLEELPTEFRLNRDFVEATVNCSCCAIYSLPFEAQILYPDLVATAISKFSDVDAVEECSDYVNPELWGNLNVAEAWFEAEGGLHEDFPDGMKEDKKFCLLVVEHFSPREMDYFVSRKLKRDKDFVMSAIAVDGMAFLLAEGGLETDFDVTLAAFSSDRADDLVEFFMDSEHNDALGYFHSFLRKVQEKLRTHEAFVKGLLCGMSPYSGPVCQLSLLQQGQETSLALKKLISEYVGIPSGKEVELLRRAEMALEGLPEPEPSDMPCTCPRCILGMSLHFVYNALR